MDEPKLQGFISYRRNQAKYAEALSKEFEARLGSHGHLDGMTLFHDTRSQKMGQNWRHQLAEALATSCVLVVIVSEDWFGSQVCRYEYRLFRKSLYELIQKFAPNMSDVECSETINNLTIAFFPEHISVRFRENLEKDNDSEGQKILKDLEDQHKVLPDTWKNKTIEQRAEDFALKHHNDVAETMANMLEKITSCDDFAEARGLVLGYLSDNQERVRSRAEGMFRRSNHIDIGIEEMPEYGTLEWIKDHRWRSGSKEQLDSKLGNLADLSFTAIPLEAEALILTEDSITGSAIRAHSELSVELEPGEMTYDFSEAFSRKTVEKLVADIADESLGLPSKRQAEELLDLLERKGNVQELQPLHAPRTLWVTNGNGEPEIYGAPLKRESAPVYLRWVGHD